MFYTYLNIVVILLLIGIGCLRIAMGEWDGLFFFVTFPFFLCAYVYLWFRHRPLRVAFRAIQRKDFQKAEEFLTRIKRPVRLFPPLRAHYELLMAFVSQSKGEEDKTEAHLRSAMKVGLKRQNNIGLSEAMLAEILVGRGEVDEAKPLLRKANRRHCNPGTTEVIREVESLFATSP